MPRKTRILHGDDEYLFVEAPGDPDGPSLQIFAKPGNPRAVAEGRVATHRTDHGEWAQVARFDGETLLLAPESPAGLGERIGEMLPRHAEARRARIAQAKHPWWFVASHGRALHGLHPAQPAGVVLKLWRTPELAKAALAALEDEASAVESTGDLREFLELRAEEGYAAALVDDQELVFFCLDESGRIQFMKVGAAEEGEEASLATHLLAENGRFEAYEGDGALEPFVDGDAWDRLLVRIYGSTPFLGHAPGWRCFVLRKDGAPASVTEPEGDGATKMVALFHDPATADEFRSRHRLGRAQVERVADLRAFVRSAQDAGQVVRLQPEDHRVRGGALWIAPDGALHLLGYAGIWRSEDGERFALVE